MVFVLITCHPYVIQAVRCLPVLSFIVLKRDIHYTEFSILLHWLITVTTHYLYTGYGIRILVFELCFGLHMDQTLFFGCSQVFIIFIFAK